MMDMPSLLHARSRAGPAVQDIAPRAAGVVVGDLGDTDRRATSRSRVNALRPHGRRHSQRRRIPHERACRDGTKAIQQRLPSTRLRPIC